MARTRGAGSNTGHGPRRGNAPPRGSAGAVREQRACGPPRRGPPRKAVTMNPRAALVLSVGLVLAALLAAVVASGTAQRIANSRATLTVTGSARRTVRSDLAVWRGSFSAQAPRIEEAYGELEASARRVRAYLVRRGFPDSAIVLSQVQTQTIYQRLPNGVESSAIDGYRLTQGVELRSPHVERIGALAREATELIQDGVRLESFPPEYLVTRLADLKVETLAAATRDARARAGEMAKNAGSAIGRLRGARMGVFQVTPALSTQVTDYGVNDTSALDKDITSVVALTFEVR